MGIEAGGQIESARNKIKRLGFARRLAGNVLDGARELVQVIENPVAPTDMLNKVTMGRSTFCGLVGATLTAATKNAAAGPPPPGAVDDLFGGEPEAAPEKASTLQLAIQELEAQVEKLPNLQTIALTAANHAERTRTRKPNIFMLSGSWCGVCKFVDPFLAHLPELYQGKIQTTTWEYDTGDGSVSDKLPLNVTDNVRSMKGFRGDTEYQGKRPDRNAIPKLFTFNRKGEAELLYDRGAPIFAGLIQKVEEEFGLKLSKEALMRALPLVVSKDSRTVQLLTQRAKILTLNPNALEGGAWHIDDMWMQVDPDLRQAAMLLVTEEDFFRSMNTNAIKELSHILKNLDHLIGPGGYLTEEICLELARRNTSVMFSEAYVALYMSNKSGIGLKMLEAAAEVDPRGFLLNFETPLLENMSLNAKDKEKIGLLVARVRHAQGQKR